jgi:ribosomal protein L16/L10AE
LGDTAWEAASRAVFRHGSVADVWVDQHPDQTLTASALARRAGD